MLPSWPGAAGFPATRAALWETVPEGDTHTVTSPVSLQGEGRKEKSRARGSV